MSGNITASIVYDSAKSYRVQVCLSPKSAKLIADGHKNSNDILRELIGAAVKWEKERVNGK